MKAVVVGLVLVCAWNRFACSKSLAASNPQYLSNHRYQFSSYPQQSHSGFNYISGGQTAIYGHVQHQSGGGYWPGGKTGNLGNYHSDPRCESICRKHTWSCDTKGMCILISRRVCLLRICPNYIPPRQPMETEAICEFLGEGTGGVVGRVTILQKDEVAHFQGEISGLNPGLHGFHVHEKGDLGENCSAALGHFNPHVVMHGDKEAKIRHVGDLGNVEAGEDGIVRIAFCDKMAQLNGHNSITGRAIVIHQHQDDLGLKGNNSISWSGNAGPRAGCCRIIKPTRPTVRPTKPTVHPTRPTVHPTRPTVHPTRPTVHSTRPTVHPTRPTVHPTRPTVNPTGPTRPTAHPTRPTVHPTRPTVHPTRPTVNPTGPTRPTVHPTRPTVHPTRPIVHPTRPTVHPTRPTVNPADSGSGGLFIDTNNGAETHSHREEEHEHDDNSDNVLEASGDDNDNEEEWEWDW